MCDIFPKVPNGGPHPLPNRLQRLKPGAMCGRMPADTCGRTMLDGDDHGHRSIVLGNRGGHIRAPHGPDTGRGHGLIMGLRAMRRVRTRRRQQPIRPHQPQHPPRRRADSSIAPPCPHLAIALPMEGRRLPHRPRLTDPRLIRARAERSGTSAPAPSLVPLPIDRRPRHAPHTTDAGQAITSACGGREGLTHQLDLRRLNERPVSTRARCSRHRSWSMVDSPSVSRRRAMSRSRASRGRCVIASWPPDRNVSRHSARRAAGTCNPRDSWSMVSPRQSRHTTAVFCWVEHRTGLAPLRAVASRVA
jgi:hypothetical protein